MNRIQNEVLNYRLGLFSPKLHFARGGYIIKINPIAIGIFVVPTAK